MKWYNFKKDNTFYSICKLDTDKYASFVVNSILDRHRLRPVMLGHGPLKDNITLPDHNVYIYASEKEQVEMVKKEVDEFIREMHQ